MSTFKLDQSFVRLLGPRQESAALVSAVVSLACDLGIECVSEGVQSARQSRVLLQRGCTTAQGFFFSPPMLAGDRERLFGAYDEREEGATPPAPAVPAPTWQAARH